MTRKFDPSNKDVLISSQRQQSLDAFRVMSLIPVRPYHVVADVGCGPGYFAIPLAKHVFDGKVFALDVQQEMLDATQEELKRINLTNVDLVLFKESKLTLEDDSLDGALLAFALHEADSPHDLLKDVRRCLRNGAWVALLEWEKREMEEGPPLKERIDEPELSEIALKAELQFTARHSLNENQYMLVMRK